MYLVVSACYVVVCVWLCVGIGSADEDLEPPLHLKPRKGKGDSEPPHNRRPDGSKEDLEPPPGLNPQELKDDLEDFGPVTRSYDWGLLPKLRKRKYNADLKPPLHCKPQFGNDDLESPPGLNPQELKDDLEDFGPVTRKYGWGPPPERMNRKYNADFEPRYGNDHFEPPQDLRPVNSSYDWGLPPELSKRKYNADLNPPLHFKPRYGNDDLEPPQDVRPVTRSYDWGPPPEPRKWKYNEDLEPSSHLRSRKGNDDMEPPQDERPVNRNYDWGPPPELRKWKYNEDLEPPVHFKPRYENDDLEQTLHQRSQKGNDDMEPPEDVKPVNRNYGWGPPPELRKRKHDVDLEPPLHLRTHKHNVDLEPRTQPKSRKGKGNKDPNVHLRTRKGYVYFEPPQHLRPRNVNVVESPAHLRPREVKLESRLRHQADQKQLTVVDGLFYVRWGNGTLDKLVQQATGKDKDNDNSVHVRGESDRWYVFRKYPGEFRLYASMLPLRYGPSPYFDDGEAWHIRSRYGVFYKVTHQGLRHTSSSLTCRTEDDHWHKVPNTTRNADLRRVILSLPRADFTRYPTDNFRLRRIQNDTGVFFYLEDDFGDKRYAKAQGDSLVYAITREEKWHRFKNAPQEFNMYISSLPFVYGCSPFPTDQEI